MLFHSGASRGQAVDFVVGDGDRLADAFVDRAGFALEPVAQHRQRHVRGFAAGGLTADAVDDREEAAAGIDVEAVFVDFALQAGIGGAGGGEGVRGPHRSNPHSPLVTSVHT